EGRFDRLKTGVAENSLRRPPRFLNLDFGFQISSGPPLEREAAQLTRECCLEAVGVHVSHGMEQFPHLMAAGLDDARIGVSGGGDSERGCQVEIPFAVRGPDARA